MTAGGQTTRIHGPFISDNEIENIVKSLQKQGQPEYDDEITKEEEENNEAELLFEFGSAKKIEDLSVEQFIKS